MTNRERAMNILHFKAVDRLPSVHFGYWSELLEEWAMQGKIPKEIVENNWDGSEKDRVLDELIGWDFNWSYTRGANHRLMPGTKFELVQYYAEEIKKIKI